MDVLHAKLEAELKKNKKMKVKFNGKENDIEKT